MSDPKWIRFVPALSRPGAKTSRWRVHAKQGDVFLGEIKWDTGWRRYVFAPWPSTIFEQDCLRDIATFCEERTTEHKRARMVEKATT